jgi:hypothetical protein
MFLFASEQTAAFNRPSVEFRSEIAALGDDERMPLREEGNG